MRIGRQAEDFGFAFIEENVAAFGRCCSKQLVGDLVFGVELESGVDFGRRDRDGG